MAETVTLKGQKFSLKGSLIKAGEIAPDCELIGAELKSVRLSSFQGKSFVLMSVPSLDTPVCSREAHTFNQEMDQFKEWLNVICVSMDLPFAQLRWCAAEGAKNIVTLSDYKSQDFGIKYGVLIEELGLLARSVYLLDPSMKVVSCHLVKEISQEPDYPKIMEEIHQLISTARK